jgi:PiT family inorganic phosphate transporter
VAKTIGHGIVDPSLLVGNAGQIVVLSALLGAIIWNLVTWWLSLPSSSSHALVGSLIGTAVAAKGFGVLELHNPEGLPKIAIALVASPILGLFAGMGMMRLFMALFASTAPSKLNRTFKVMQVFSANFMAFSHGSNDAQKSMGIITMALVVGRFLPGGADVPVWVKIACATAMALGTAMGGWRIIKTVGKKIMGLQPVHGFASESAAACVILTCSHFGAPVSTTHVISSSIMGVGSATRLSSVKWGTVGQILLAWIMTLPISFALGCGCYYALHAIL